MTSEEKMEWPAFLKSALTATFCILMAASCGVGGDDDDDDDDDHDDDDFGGSGTAATLVLGANDLGMHCVDGSFEVFSILPPFNVIEAQVVQRTPYAATRLLGPTDARVVYSATTDSTGSRNSASIGKTDYWDYADILFGGPFDLGEGLTGLYMPDDAPNPGAQNMVWDATHGWFAAAGVPIFPTDDLGATNPYPLMRLTAQNAQTGAALGSLDIVVPVSDETDCTTCHATGGIASTQGGIVWSSRAPGENQAKENILKLHDTNHGTALEQSQPVLCASCHYSAALDLVGSGPTGAQLGKPSMSATMHDYHGALTDSFGDPLFPVGGTADETCYRCHPGGETQCQRGAMRTGGMECFECHGDMSAVGGARAPWIDLPKCQSCHTGDALTFQSGGGRELAADGIRLRQAWLTGDATADPISAPNSRFAEESGKLYRQSKGHGGLACMACHGSPHAIWPHSDASANDNVAANQIQGHSGTITDCSACHGAQSIPLGLNGPHGMHPLNDSGWREDHEDFYRINPSSCKSCHGADYRGTALAQTACNQCHAMPNGSPNWDD